MIKATAVVYSKDSLNLRCDNDQIVIADYRIVVFQRPPVDRISTYTFTPPELKNRKNLKRVENQFLTIKLINSIINKCLYLHVSVQTVETEK